MILEQPRAQAEWSERLCWSLVVVGVGTFEGCRSRLATTEDPKRRSECANFGPMCRFGPSPEAIYAWALSVASEVAFCCGQSKWKSRHSGPEESQ